MFKCVKCGKEYKHRSALSRHVRGNPNQRARPCEGVGVVEVVGEEVRTVQNHDLSGKTPTGINARAIVGKARSIQEIPVVWLKEVHMNPEIPHLWNVVLGNMSTKMMCVYENEWGYVRFKIWADTFIKHVIQIYLQIVTVENDNGEAVRILMFDHRKEVEESLMDALSGPMRNTIKRKNKLS